MSKIIPLIIANLKGFIRDWKAIILLIVFPLVLITLIFVSFNPEGIQRIPIGFIDQTGEISNSQYMSTFSTYLKLREFNSVEDCIANLKNYNSYVCVNVIVKQAIILDVYYDNTREPVIWEVISKIKATVDYMQKIESKRLASDFLNKFGTTIDKTENFKVNLIDVHGNLDDYIKKTDESIIELRTAKSDLSATLDEMDRDIASVKLNQAQIRNEKSNFYSQSNYYLNHIDNQLTSGNDVILLRNEINSYNNRADNKLYEMDRKIERYEQSSERGRDYVHKMDKNIEELKQVKEDLYEYKGKLKRLDNEIGYILDDFTGVRNIDPETLVNPIVVKNIPVYIPDFQSDEPINHLTYEEEEIKRAVKGFNLLNLQTIFPKILLLIVLFLSLLISNFICLKNINSAANKRIKLIRRIFFPEIISIYLSSLIIMITPLICVALLGNFLFQLPFLNNLGILIILLFLLTSVFILMGMSLAYLIKKESMTLLVTTFLLVFFIFFSGFLLPIERMSVFASFFARFFPSKVALSIFNKTVFYNISAQLLLTEITILVNWLICLFFVVVFIKKIRRG